MSSDFLCIEDLRKEAERRVPRMFYEYVDAGSWSEKTYRWNHSDLSKLKFHQRVAIDIAHRTTKSNMLDRDVSIPVALAPTGLAGMIYADGEILAAKAAEKFGVPFVLSMMSICSIEDVAAHTTKPFWLQVYILKDRAFLDNLMERALAARCEALVVTLDLQVGGSRYKDVRNGLAAPPRLRPRALLSMLRRPGWCMKMLATSRHYFGNVVGHVEGVRYLIAFRLGLTIRLDGDLEGHQGYPPQMAWKTNPQGNNLSSRCATCGG